MLLVSFGGGGIVGDTANSLGGAGVRTVFADVASQQEDEVFAAHVHVVARDGDGRTGIVRRSARHVAPRRLGCSVLSSYRILSPAQVAGLRSRGGCRAPVA